jgi:beta-lactamase class D
MRKTVIRSLLPALALALATAAAPASARTVCTAIADAASGAMLLKQGDCGNRVTPASTFKIALSLMGYDSGFLKDVHTPTLPFQPGYTDAGGEEWRKDTDPERWMKYSVVWYSRQITQALGEANFQHYVNLFDYGNRDLAGDPGKHNGLQQAWITSSLRISPQEQLSFLRKLVNRKLPVSKHAYDMTARIMLLDQRPGGWEVHGKTGSGGPVAGDGSQDPVHDYGWFVGWAVKDGRSVVFARLIQDDRDEAGFAGLRARAAFLDELPAMLAAPLQ